MNKDPAMPPLNRFPRMMQEYLTARLRENYRANHTRVMGLKTRAGAEAYCAGVRDQVAQVFGPWPERTPLNIRITGELDRDGCATRLTPAPAERMPRWAETVSQTANSSWEAPVPPETPYFAPLIPFVIPPPEGSGEPFYSHNHCPAITWCPNGDLLAAWFSTDRERGTEMTILASRLRADADAWEPASEFFKVPHRNMTGTALFYDGEGTLYHFNGMRPEGAEGWENLVLLLRTSTDNGVTWTPPQVFSPDARYQRRNQVIAGTSVTPDGLWLQACDTTPGGEGPSAVHISRDGSGWTRGFTASATEDEPKGYLAATQSPDGMIHLISSRLHYRFNLAWLRA